MKVKWYACGGSIVKLGPFESQAQAAAAIRLEIAKPPPSSDNSPGAIRAREQGWRLFPPDVFVWCEEES